MNFYAHRQEHIPEFSEHLDWSSDPEDDTDALSLLTTAALEIPGLRADTANILSGDVSVTPQEVFELLDRTQRLGAALSDWYDWFTIRLYSGPSLDATYVALHAFNSPGKDLHGDLGLRSMSTLTTYRTYLIYILQARFHCLSKLKEMHTSNCHATSHNITNLSKTLSILHNLCDEMISTTPFFLSNPAVPHEIGEVFISSALITVSMVPELPHEKKLFVENLLHGIAFSTRPRTGFEYVWDARIMTRMGKFSTVPAIVTGSASEVE